MKINIKERKIYFLCPTCNNVVDGTIQLALNVRGKVHVPDLSAQVCCPKCGAYMQDVDMLSIPIAALLNSHKYETEACCDRYNDGNFNPEDLCGVTEDDENVLAGWYYGPFVTIRKELTEPEANVLMETVQQLNKAYDDRYQFSINPTKDLDPYATEETTRHTITIMLRDPSAVGVIDANSKLLEFVITWLNTMESQGISR